MKINLKKQVSKKLYERSFKSAARRMFRHPKTLNEARAFETKKTNETTEDDEYIVVLPVKGYRARRNYRNLPNAYDDRRKSNSPYKLKSWKSLSKNRHQYDKGKIDMYVPARDFEYWILCTN